MTALDYILNGLEAELQLERELGVRSFECDRGVLAPLEEKPVVQVAVRPAPAVPSAPPAPRPVRVPAAPAAAPVSAQGAPARYDFVFLHEKPLSPKGSEMMARITTALKTTAEAAPVITGEPLPAAGIYVVLGSLALRKWLPGVKAAPGMWTSHGGSDVLVTYSPEHILRFASAPAAAEKMKREMWTSLKAVAQRAAQRK